MTLIRRGLTNIDEGTSEIKKLDHKETTIGIDTAMLQENVDMRSYLDTYFQWLY